MTIYAFLQILLKKIKLFNAVLLNNLIFIIKFNKPLLRF